jgi:hypothetical protein
MSRRTCWVIIVALTSRYQIADIDRSLIDLNAIAWLEDYLQTWPGTLLVVYVKRTARVPQCILTIRVS